MRVKRFLPCGENILDKYTVKIYAGAYRGLDNICIAEKSLRPWAWLTNWKNVTFSLEQLAGRGVVRHIGAYAGSGYRQLS